MEKVVEKINNQYDKLMGDLKRYKEAQKELEIEDVWSIYFNLRPSLDIDGLYRGKSQKNAQFIP